MPARGLPCVALALVALSVTAMCAADLSHPAVVTLDLLPPKPLTSTLSHPETRSAAQKLGGALAPPDTLNGCPAMDFAAPFTVGGQPFQLIVDTGSTTLALASNQCAGSCPAGLQPLYTPSSTSVDLHTPVNGTYLDGSGWWGREIRDSVVTATGLPGVPLVLAAIDGQKSFFSASTCSATNGGYFYEGIIGFAFANQAQGDTQWYFQQLVNATAQSGDPLPNVFGIQMCLSSGKLWLGGYDASVSSAPLQYVNIIDDSYYVVLPVDMTVGGVSVGFDSAAYGQTIVDSGTSAMVLPKAIYTAVVELVVASPAFTAALGGKTFFTSGNCIAPKDGSTLQQLNANLPPLTVVLGNATAGGGNVTLTLLPVSSYVNYQPDVNGNPFYCSGIDKEDTDTVLGWSFITQFLVVHDLSANAIGFAPLTATACPNTEPDNTARGLALRAAAKSAFAPSPAQQSIPLL